MFLFKSGSIDPALDGAVSYLQEYGKTVSTKSAAANDTASKVKEAADTTIRILQDRGINFQRGVLNGFFQTVPTRINLRLQDLQEVLKALIKEGQEPIARLQLVVRIAEAAVVIHAHADVTVEAFSAALQVLETLLFHYHVVDKGKRCGFHRGLLMATRGIGKALEAYLEEKKPVEELKRRLHFLIDLIDALHVPSELFQQDCYAGPAYLFRLRQKNPYVFGLDRFSRVVGSNYEPARWGLYHDEFERLAKLDLRRCEKPSFVIVPQARANPEFRLIFSSSMRSMYVRHSSANWYFKLPLDEKCFTSLDTIFALLPQQTPAAAVGLSDDLPMHLEDLPEFRDCGSFNPAFAAIRYPISGRFAIDNTRFPFVYCINRIEREGVRKFYFYFHPVTRRCSLIKPQLVHPPLSWLQLRNEILTDSYLFYRRYTDPDDSVLLKPALSESARQLRTLMESLKQLKTITQAQIDQIETTLSSISQYHLNLIRITQDKFSSSIKGFGNVNPEVAEEIISLLQLTGALPSLNCDLRKSVNRTIEVVRICHWAFSIYQGTAQANMQACSQAVHQLHGYLFEPYFCFKLHEKISPYKLRIVRHLSAVGASLEQLAQIPGLTSFQIAQLQSLRDLIFAMNVPRELLETSAYHGMSFILTQYQKYPNFFSKSLSERYPTSGSPKRTDYVKRHLQDKDYLLLPPFAQDIWSGVNTFHYHFKTQSDEYCKVLTLDYLKEKDWYSPLPPQYPFETFDSNYSSVFAQPGCIQLTLNQCLNLAALKNQPKLEDAAAIAQEHRTIRPAFLKKVLEETRLQFPDSIPYCFVQGRQGNEIEILFLDDQNQMRSLFVHYTSQGLWRTFDTMYPCLESSWPKLLEQIFQGKRMAPTKPSRGIIELFYQQCDFSPAFRSCAPDLPLKKAKPPETPPPAAAASFADLPKEDKAKRSEPKPLAAAAASGKQLPDDAELFPL